MSKQKSLSQLEAERAACEQKLVQLQHKVQQYENRIAYCEKGERRKRTHRLITRGAAVESVAPTVKALTEGLSCFLEGYGRRVIRIPNNEAGGNFRGVCAYIDAAAKQSLRQLRCLLHKGALGI